MREISHRKKPFCTEIIEENTMADITAALVKGIFSMSSGVLIEIAMCCPAGSVHQVCFISTPMSSIISCGLWYQP